MARWTIDVSSTTSVRGPRGEVDLRAKERAVVAALALHHPAAVSAAAIAPLIWGDELPATAIKSIHNHVSRIRRELPGLIETADDGYRISADAVITSSGAATGYADLADEPQVTIARARDRNDAIRAAEQAVEAEVRAGASDELCDRLDEMVRRAPHRLIRWWWLALVTARLGRRQTALDVLRECLRWHGNGRDPGVRRAIERLEQAIIRDDLFIDSPAALAPESAGATGVGSSTGKLAPSTGALGLVDPTGAIEGLVDVIDGGASTTLLVAPAGGGKTSAVRYVVEQLPALGWHCFHTSCSPIDTNPLHPIEALASQRRERRPSAPIDDARARSGPGAAGDHEVALFAALTSPTNRRVLLVVDDAHHADTATQAYLERLVGRVEAAADDQVALLITSRHDRLSTACSVVVTLPPWDERAIARYLRPYVDAGSWSTGAAAWIADVSGGNPLAARELMLEALRTVPDDPRTTPFLPPLDAPVDAMTSHDAAARRTDALRGQTRAVLRAAAVLGEEFRRSDLARLEAGSVAALAMAEARGLVEDLDDDRWRFTHQSFRQSILDAIDDSEMIALSQRAAAAIAGSPDRLARLGEIAHFARGAASRDPEYAIVTTTDVARSAFDDKRFAEALSTSRLALRLIEDHEGRTARWCSIGLLAGKVGIDIGADDAVGLLTDAGDRAIELGEHDLVGEAAWLLCALSPITAVGTLGDVQQRFLDHALAHVVDPAVRARVCAAGAFAWALADVPERSRRLYFEADAHSVRSGDPLLRADVLLRAYTPLSQPGDVPTRRQVAAELHELGERFDEIEYTYEACRLDFGDAIHWGTSDPRPALQRIEEMAARLDQRGRNWSLVSFRATVALLDGDFAAAEHHAEHLLSDEVTASPELVLSTYGAHLLAIRLAQGRIAELDPLIADIVSRQPELQIWKAVRCLTAAELEPAIARSSFDAVVQGTIHTIPPNFTMLAGLIAVGEGALRLGDEPRMRTVIDHLTPFEDRWGWFNVGTIGPVDLTLARLHSVLDDRDAARRAATRGLRSADRVGAPFFAARLADLLVDLAA